MKKQKGFTLIEMMLVIIILSIVSSIIFFSFSSMNDKQILDKQISLIKNLIGQTRTNALNSKNGKNQTVILATSTVVYDGKVIDLINGVELYAYDLSTSTIVFYRITGLPSATGTFTYALKKGSTIVSTSSISINNLGIIE